MAKNEAIYGVSTGFGGSANTRIKDPKISSEALLTHTVNGFNTCLPTEVVRAMMLLRVNTLIRGHSAVRRQVIESLLHAFNAGVAPKVPERGSVSASGDLAPLAYIASFMAGKPYSYAEVPG
jgi:histidine ammonia-lyase